MPLKVDDYVADESLPIQEAHRSISDTKVSDLQVYRAFSNVMT
jgi:hypothetical protein